MGGGRRNFPRINIISRRARAPLTEEDTYISLETFRCPNPVFFCSKQCQLGEMRGCRMHHLVVPSIFYTHTNIHMPSPKRAAFTKEQMKFFGGGFQLTRVNTRVKFFAS